MTRKYSLSKKIKKMISRRLIVYYYLFILVSILSVFVEVIGISSISILISALLNENINFIIDLDKMFNHFGLRDLNNFDNFKDYYFSFIIFLIFFKFVFSLTILFLEAKLSKDTHIHLKSKFFRHYMGLDYIDYVKYNLAHIQRNIEVESNTINSFFHASVRTIKNLFLFFFFIVILAIANLKVTMMIFIILFLMVTAFVITVRKMVKKNSEEMIFYKGKITQWVIQAARSIVDIKFLDLEKKLSDEFNRNIYKFEIRAAWNRIFSGLPSSFFELLGLIFIIILIFLLYRFGLLAQYLPLVTLYLITFARLLPSAISISSSLVILRAGLVSLDFMINEIELKNTKLKVKNIVENKTDYKFENQIEIKNLNFSYNQKPVITKINMNIKKGSVVSLTGGSGVGKSTFLKLISGLLEPDEGEIIVDGVNINRNLYEWRKCIGYLSQHVYLIDDSIKNNITILDKDINNLNYLNAIKNSNLKSFINSLEHKDNTLIGDDASFVSGGQKQRIALARILYLNRDIIVLDEFTNNLDDKTAHKIFEQLLNNFKGKKTIIFATHDKELAKLSDQNYNF